MLLLLCSCVLLASAQQTIDLKQFRGGNVSTTIAAPAPYAIFVSATSDPAELLQQVTVVSEDGTNHTMFEMTQRKQFPTTGQLLPFIVVRSAFVTANLTDDQMNTLTGFMFISSTKQLEDNNFFVIDVDRTQKLSWSGLGAINTTVLFLNSNMMSTPWHSSTISTWSQPSDASVYLYRGFPTDEPEKNSSYIFANPFSTTDFYVYIYNVEQFSLSLSTFYIKSFKGVGFVIRPEYYEVDETATSAYTTTGLYMKPINRPDKTAEIYTVRDRNYAGTVGANIVGDVPADGKVTVGEHEGLSFSSGSVHPVDQIQGWSTQSIGDVLQIASTSAQAGEFYVQYYIIQGMQLPVTSTTATRIQTTTKSSKSAERLIPLIFILLVVF